MNIRQDVDVRASLAVHPDRLRLAVKAGCAACPVNPNTSLGFRRNGLEEEGGSIDSRCQDSNAQRPSSGSEGLHAVSSAFAGVAGFNPICILFRRLGQTGAGYQEKENAPHEFILVVLFVMMLGDRARRL